METNNLPLKDRTCPLHFVVGMAQMSNIAGKPPEPACVTFTCEGERCVLYSKAHGDCKISVALDGMIRGSKQGLAP